MKSRISLLVFVIISLNLLNQSNSWTGSIDTDWHKACNWSLNTIPTITHDVTIPNVTNYPIVSGNAHCRTLSITSTASNAITIQSSLGADLCISSTNGGACSTTITDNGGCTFHTTSTAAICENQTKALTSTVPGTFSVLSGGGSIAGTTYTPANVTSNTSVTIRFDDGGGNIEDVTFTVNVLNTAVNSTSTAAICETQTKALVGSPGGGSWSIVSGGGSISGTTYTPPNISVTTPVTIRYTIPTNGACPASTSDRTFDVDPSPGVANNTTSTASICEGGATKSLTATPSGGTWSIASGPGSISGTTYTSPSIASSTNVTVRYTIPASGACPATTSDRTFTVIDNTPANNTTSTLSICETSTKTLTATPSGGSWSIVSGGGSISGTTYTPPNVASNTAVTVRYSIPAAGSCPASSSDRTFTVNPAPAPANNTTSTATICETQTKALTGSPGGGSWNVISGGGSISGTTYTPPNIGSNTVVTVRYTIAASGSCPATTSDRSFTVNPAPASANNTTSTAAICETQTKSLTATPGGGSWSVISGGGSISGSTYTPANVASNTTVTIRYTVPASGVCPGSTSDRSFTVNAAPTAANNTTSTAAICETQTKSLTGTPGGGSWSIISGGGSISGSTYTPPNVASNTTVTVRYTIPGNGACPATTSNRSFTVNAAPSAANNTTSTATICEIQTKPLTGTPGGGSWSIVSGGGSISGSTYTPANISSNTNVTVRYTIPANGACPATTSNRTFTVNPALATANNTTSTASIFDNQTKALSGTPGGGSWSIITGGGSISGSTYTPADVGGPTTVRIRYTIPANGACPATTDDVVFTVDDAGCPNLLSNPSFATYSSCPTGMSQISRADNWYNYTATTTDYYNCAVTTVTTAGANPPPTPLPGGGTGYIGVHSFNGGSMPWVEYAGLCLSTPLVNGTTYEFSFSVAGANNSNPNRDFGIFGQVSCGTLTTITNRSGTSPYEGLLPRPGHTNLLGSTAVSVSNGSWTRYTITFTPTQGYPGIVVGPSTIWGTSTTGSSSDYTYMDDFELCVQ